MVKTNIRLNISNFTASTYKEVYSMQKITLYLIGMISIIALGKILKLPDWDFYLSIIMPTLTFLTSGITTGKAIKAYTNQDRYFILYVLIWLIFFELNVDIVYVLYNAYMHHMYFRIPNLIGSSLLYLLCCAVLSYKVKA